MDCKSQEVVMVMMMILTMTEGEPKGAIHSTKIQTGPNGKSGPPQMVDQFFRNFSG